ncbi:G3E family GTPase [Pseudomonas citronellolis]|uniref:CobW family GTP-binding protein n=1 Tax=Pseudomonas citronellolis TaxID=53408 RepID=UPI0020A1F5F3|nr:GTP-binding protein [Pseudomonas citronellolis]MCP1645412.1 G3E family GTPase [Pseudomonas citronellolis]MCP1668801.1 G3E family GTPase [Pseudomonas citronellolis]MCP1699790.1 G3E family GTPase [Pseudomonas citronellolis]MCP1703710.1 G3E family GTPase [Pseudomonas citronellolis]MCP1800468.1 G3E family GTPase [Pseudomonas citronellolis]
MSIPVTVVAGFLGAGKTTLLRRLVQQCAGQRLALIVNDFGELNVDAEMIAEQSDAVYALQNGCLCCTMQDDLLAQLGRLAAMQPPVERIVIECSGVADPQPIIQALGYPQLRRHMHLDALITLVDAARSQPLEGEYAQLERRQAAAADLLLLNKADIATPEQLQALRQRFGEPRRMLQTVQAEIPDELLYGERPERAQRLAPLGVDHGRLFDSWTWRHSGQLDPRRLRAWLDQLPEGLFRLKGRVQVSGREQPLWLQYVGGRSQFLAAQAEEGENCLVFIASADAGLRERLEASLEQCLAA